jgi:hypothetical protein
LVLKRTAREEEKKQCQTPTEDLRDEDGEAESSRKLYITIPFIAGTLEKIARIQIYY